MHETGGTALKRTISMSLNSPFEINTIWTQRSTRLIIIVIFNGGENYILVSGLQPEESMAGMVPLGDLLRHHFTSNTNSRLSPAFLLMKCLTFYWVQILIFHNFNLTIGKLSFCFKSKKFPSSFSFDKWLNLPNLHFDDGKPGWIFHKHWFVTRLWSKYSVFKMSKHF